MTKKENGGTVINSSDRFLGKQITSDDTSRKVTEDPGQGIDIPDNGGAYQTESTGSGNEGENHSNLVGEKVDALTQSMETVQLLLDEVVSQNQKGTELAIRSGEKNVPGQNLMVADQFDNKQVQEIGDVMTKMLQKIEETSEIARIESIQEKKNKIKQDIIARRNEREAYPEKRKKAEDERLQANENTLETSPDFNKLMDAFYEENPEISEALFGKNKKVRVRDWMDEHSYVYGMTELKIEKMIDTWGENDLDRLLLQKRAVEEVTDPFFEENLDIAVSLSEETVEEIELLIQKSKDFLMIREKLTKNMAEFYEENPEVLEVLGEKKEKEIEVFIQKSKDFLRIQEKENDVDEFAKENPEVFEVLNGKNQEEIESLIQKSKDLLGIQEDSMRENFQFLERNQKVSKLLDGKRYEEVQVWIQKAQSLCTLIEGRKKEFEKEVEILKNELSGEISWIVPEFAGGDERKISLLFSDYFSADKKKKRNVFLTLQRTPKLFDDILDIILSKKKEQSNSNLFASSLVFVLTLLRDTQRGLFINIPADEVDSKEDESLENQMPFIDKLLNKLSQEERRVKDGMKGITKMHLVILIASVVRRIDDTVRKNIEKGKGFQIEERDNESGLFLLLEKVYRFRDHYEKLFSVLQNYENMDMYFRKRARVDQNYLVLYNNNGSSIDKIEAMTDLVSEGELEIEETIKIIEHTLPHVDQSMNDLIMNVYLSEEEKVKFFGDGKMVVNKSVWNFFVEKFKKRNTHGDYGKILSTIEEQVICGKNEKNIDNNKETSGFLYTSHFLEKVLREVLIQKRKKQMNILEKKIESVESNLSFHRAALKIVKTAAASFTINSLIEELTNSINTDDVQKHDVMSIVEVLKQYAQKKNGRDKSMKEIDADLTAEISSLQESKNSGLNDLNEKKKEVDESLKNSKESYYKCCFDRYISDFKELSIENVAGDTGAKELMERSAQSLHQSIQECEQLICKVKSISKRGSAMVAEYTKNKKRLLQQYAELNKIYSILYTDSNNDGLEDELDQVSRKYSLLANCLRDNGGIVGISSIGKVFDTLCDKEDSLSASLRVKSDEKISSVFDISSILIEGGSRDEIRGKVGRIEDYFKDRHRDDIVNTLIKAPAIGTDGWNQRFLNAMISVDKDIANMRELLVLGKEALESVPYAFLGITHEIRQRMKKILLAAVLVVGAGTAVGMGGYYYYSDSSSADDGDGAPQVLLDTGKKMKR